MTGAADLSRGPSGAGIGGFRFHGGSVNLARRELQVHGALRRIEPKVFDLLWHLLVFEGRVVTRDQLLQVFWTDERASDGALSRAMMKLRQALQGVERQSGGPVQLRTVHRVGYRLDVDGLVRDPPSAQPAGRPGLGPLLQPWLDDGLVAGGRPTGPGPALAPAAQAVARALALGVPADPGPAEDEPALAPPVRTLMLQVLGQAASASAWAEALAHALADLGHAAAWPGAVRAMARDQDAKLLAVAAHGHRLLAQGRINRHGVDAQADQHLQEALRLALASGERELALETQITQANLDVQRGQIGRGRALYERLLADHDTAREPLQYARVLNSLGTLDARGGDLVGARSRFERALRHCRQQGLEPLALCAASNLAMMQLDLACLADAAETIDPVIEQLAGVQPPRLAADLALTGCWVHAEAGMPARIEPLLPLLASWQASADRPVQVLSLLAQGLYAAACGQPAQALAAVRQAVAMAQTMEEQLRLVDWIGLWKRAAVRAGDADSLQQARAAVQALRHGAPRDETLAGDELHIEAALCCQQRRLDQASRRLAEALAAYRPGALASRTRHDSAWICAEQGRPAKGRAMLRDLPHWREEHPLGWKLHARLLAAEGDAAEAARWQQRLVDRLGASAHGFDRDLLRALHAAAAGAGGPLPESPLLPSLLMPSL